MKFSVAVKVFHEKMHEHKDAKSVSKGKELEQLSMANIAPRAGDDLSLFNRKRLGKLVEPSATALTIHNNRRK
jgi:hypothetical protein